MPWSTDLTKLCDILASLYVTSQDAQRVVAQVGLDARFIAFDAKAINTWYNILIEADKLNKVAALIDVALQEYPENDLLALAQNNTLNTQRGHDTDSTIYRQGPSNPEKEMHGTNQVSQQASQSHEQRDNPESADSSQVTRPSYGNPTYITINTGGGAYIGGNVKTDGGDVVGRDQSKGKDASQDANEKAVYKQSLPANISKQFLEVTTKVDGLSFMQGLWPLEITNKSEVKRDANYDFPILEDTFSNLGEEQIYYVLSNSGHVHAVPIQTQETSAEDICRRWLLNYSHQIVTGHRFSGKTWLRLYLERYTLITNATLLPLFFFAPAGLQFFPNDLASAWCLARSVAHQLFLKLLIQADLNGEEIDALMASFAGITPFLKKYGYDIYLGDVSLAQPAPPVSVLDIDNVYQGNQVYKWIKKRIQEVELLSTPHTIDQILYDIKTTVEILGYSKLFVLIDNWDRISASTRNALLTQILSPPFLIELAKREIYFKVFVPTIQAELHNYFYQVCLLERRSETERFRLSIYSYT